MTQDDLHAGAFPKIDEAHMAALERCAGASLKHRAGQRLIAVGERDFSSSSAASELWVEHGAKPVAEQVESEDGEHDRNAGEDAHPRSRLEVGAALVQHRSP